MGKSNLTSSPSLVIKYLVIKGRNKDYTVAFKDGLNIIHGDSDTGKSSILNLIDYLLGASHLDLYSELEKNGKYLLLQVNLNGKPYTIKRDIFDEKAYIQVFSSEIEGIDSLFPREYSPNYSKEGPDGYFSDFLMQELNIPLVKVKKAPSKPDSPTARVSFREIIKFCYLNQDDVGSKNLLGVNNYSQYPKVKETFKFLHKLLDTQITNVENEIKEKTKQKTIHETSFKNVASFFRGAKFASTEELSEDLRNVNNKIIEVEQEINDISQKITLDTNQFQSVRNIINQFESKIYDANKLKDSKEISLDQKFRLKEEYVRDIEKIETSIKFKDNIRVDNQAHVDCPVCKRAMNVNDLQMKLGGHSYETLNSELKSLKNHLKSLMNIIELERNDINKLDERIKIFDENLESHKRFLDKESHRYISPYISQRDTLVSKEASLQEKKREISYLIKLRKQLDQLNLDAEKLGLQIKDLNVDLRNLKESAPSIQVVIQKLADYLDDFLNSIPIRNLSDTRIDEKSYLPIVRNQQYVNLTSGGLRTIVSIGFFVSILKNSILTDTHMPRFLMIDTVGKYLGKTSDSIVDESNQDLDDDVTLEGLSDPDKYHNIYEYFIQLDDLYGDNIQIILVDNDIPENVVNSSKDFVRKYFKTDGKFGAEIGLINDAK
jgi:hypothetical protein